MITHRWGLFALGCSLLASVAAAQGPTRIEVSFSNPGARSLGLGGAFIALADDATGAFANPSGLVKLTRPEVSLEGRLWSYDTPFLESGRISGAPTGIGIDTEPGLIFSTSADDVAGLSFLSVVYPVKRWSFAFYRHLLSQFEYSSVTQGLFSELPGGGTFRHVEFGQSIEIDFVTYGISAGFRVSDKFSLGFGVAYHEGKTRLVQQSYIPPGTFDPTPLVYENLFGETVLNIDDTDWAILLGFLWQATSRWSFGGAYRQGPEFTMIGAAFAGPRFDPEIEPGTVIDGGTTPIDFPDVYGLGFAYRSKGEALTLSFEWDRVEYSTILESFDPEVISPNRPSMTATSSMAVWSTCSRTPPRSSPYASASGSTPIIAFGTRPVRSPKLPWHRAVTTSCTTRRASVWSSSVDSSSTSVSTSPSWSIPSLSPRSTSSEPVNLPSAGRREAASAERRVPEKRLAVEVVTTRDHGHRIQTGNDVDELASPSRGEDHRSNVGGIRHGAPPPQVAVVVGLRTLDEYVLARGGSDPPLGHDPAISPTAIPEHEQRQLGHVSRP